MLAQTFAHAKPGKNDRDPAADWLAFVEPTALAHKQERWFINLPKPGYVRPVKIDFGCAPGRRNLQHRQFALAIEKHDTPSAVYLHSSFGVAGFHTYF